MPKDIRSLGDAERSPTAVRKNLFGSDQVQRKPNEVRRNLFGAPNPPQTPTNGPLNSDPFAIQGGPAALFGQASEEPEDGFALAAIAVRQAVQAKPETPIDPNKPDIVLGKKKKHVYTKEELKELGLDKE